MSRQRFMFLLMSAMPLLISQSACGVATKSQDRTDPVIDCTIEALPGSHEWSHDGSGLAFVSRDQGVQILSLDSRRVMNARNPPIHGAVAWAHHDDRMAILQSHGTDEAEVAIATLYIWHSNDDAPPKILAQSLSANLKPAWAPNDRRVLAENITGELVAIDPMTGTSQTVYRSRDSDGGPNGDPVWIDDNRIALQVGLGKLVEIDVRTGATRDLASDGLYAQLISDGDGRLWALTYSGKVFRLVALPEKGSALLESEWMRSADGPTKKGAFVASFIDGSGFRIVDAATGVISKIPNNPGDSNPRWSPAGDRIAFSRVGPHKASNLLCVMPVPARWAKETAFKVGR